MLRIASYTLNGKAVPAGTPGATRRKVLSRKWYGAAGGKQVPLSSDKQAARQLLAAMRTEAAKRAAGIGTPFDVHAKAVIGKHLDDWQSSLADKGTPQSRISLIVGRCRAVIKGRGFARVGDIDAPAVQRYLARLRDAENKSIQTVNYYLNAFKQFCRWLTLNRRIAASPVAHLTGGNARLDRRHDRRNLSDSELATLFEAAESGEPIRGLTGPDRAMLYRVAALTGFRASELASLTPESFRLDGDSPSVAVRAAYAKNRRDDSVPLHPTLVPLLAKWLAEKPAGVAVWPGKWAEFRHGGRMLKADLAAARAAWISASESAERVKRESSDFLAYRDAAGQYANFHAPRHTFISGLVSAGVAPKLARQLARHGSITLTMDRYAHTSEGDRRAALRSLPGLPPADPGCTPVAQTPCNSVHPGSVPCSEAGGTSTRRNEAKCLENQSTPGDCAESPRRDSDPRPPAYKAGALTTELRGATNRRM